MKPWIGIAATSLWLLGCAAPRVVKTALHGDLGSLKREIAASQAAGHLGPSEFRALARAIAGREVRSAQGRDALERLRDVRSCAGELLPILKDRAQSNDEVGAAATLLLIEQGKGSLGHLAEQYLSSQDGAWRAVGTRAAVAPEFGQLRQVRLVDSDQRARRGALLATWLVPRGPASALRGDSLDAVVEAARLDPDPTSRVIATRVLGAVGGESQVLHLEDHWARADDTVRSAILLAWATPKSFESGGERELVRVMETEPSLLALEAAELLLERNSASNAPVARARLLRALEEGTTEERRFVVLSKQLSGTDFLGLLKKLRKDHDRQVRILVLARLLDAQDASAKSELLELAKGDNDLGFQARAALAVVGEPSIAPALERQLLAKHSRQRRLAALSLVRLGLFAKAAPALGDDDPRVRTQVACAVLSGTRPLGDRTAPTLSPIFD